MRCFSFFYAWGVAVEGGEGLREGGSRPTLMHAPPSCEKVYRHRPRYGVDLVREISYVTTGFFIFMPFRRITKKNARFWVAGGFFLFVNGASAEGNEWEFADVDEGGTLLGKGGGGGTFILRGFNDVNFQ